MAADTSRIRHYFAFGANMNPQVMVNRGKKITSQIPAIAIGKAVLENYSLNMNLTCSSQPDIHYASITQKEGAFVEGVLWEVTDSMIEALDFYEGVHTNQYTREIVDVIAKTGQIIHAYTYIGNPDKCLQTGEKGKITTIYRDKMISGALHFGLSDERINELKKWPTLVLDL